MRTRSPQRTSRDGGLPLSELLAWHGLEGGGWLRGANGSLSATLEVRHRPSGAVLATLAAQAADRLGAGWSVLAEIQRRPAAGAGGPGRRRAFLTVTRQPTAAPPTRRAAVGRRRRRQELLEADLQLQGDVEARLERLIRRPTAARYALRRLDGRRMVRFLHATLTGRWPARLAAGTAGLDRLLSGVRLHRDGGLRCGESWIVPVLVVQRRDPVHPDLPTLLDGVRGPVRAVFRPTGGLRPAGRPARDPLTVRDLLALPGGAHRAAHRRGTPSGATLLAFDIHRRRAAHRAAALAERLRDAGYAARIDAADPAAAYLASLPAHGRTMNTAPGRSV